MTTMTIIYAIFALLVAFQVKHYLADFPLQTKYMLGKFHHEENVWVPALLAHVAVHGVFTFAISFMYFFWVVTTGVETELHSESGPGLFPSVIMVAFSLAYFDMMIHFIMDRIKAAPRLLGRYKPEQKPFWLVLGLDQAVHHLTHYGIIAALIMQTI